MNKKWAPHIITVWTFVVFIVLGLACASSPDSSASSSSYEIVYTEVPFSELSERIRQVNSPGQGFIVEAYFNATNAPGEGSFSIGANPIPNPTDRDRWWIKGHGSNRITGHSSDYRGYAGPYETYADALQFEQYDDQTYKRIDKNKPYRIYISVHNVYNNGRWTPIIDRIEGLRSLEEVAAIEAQQKADREAAEVARRQAIEEANRYDPANFIIVPSNFKPGDYTKADLFSAVAASERLEIVALGWFNQTYTPSREFVSDVVFVSQDGTDITFRTADNAISRRMKVDSRTGLYCFRHENTIKRLVRKHR
jgi:hypothetical protein